MTTFETIERARRARMARAWTTLEPTDAEIAAARAHFFSRRKSKRRGRAVPVILAFATLLVAGASFAGARLYALHRSAPSGHEANPPILEPVVRSGPASKRPPPALAAAPVLEPTASALATAEPTLSLPVESLPIAPHPAPAILHGTTTPASSVVSPVVSNPWAQAADAMRRGDHEAADQAFGAMTRSEDPRVRDEARLARAQIWLADGRIDEARAELQRLAAAGATPLVRESARDALTKIRSSKAGPAGTNDP
jgi:hypothetical protein